MRKSDMAMVVRLLKMVGPLTPVLILSALAGVMSHLSVTAFFLVGAYGAVKLLYGSPVILWSIFAAMLVLAAVRGFFRYLEQYSGHYVAFRLLAMIRDRVFAALRRLAPAKMEAKNSGEIISAVTSDIELIEIFYAHTIAPVFIGIVVSAVMTVFLWFLHPAFGLIGLAGYVLLGAVLPMLNYSLAKNQGTAIREKTGRFHHLLLDAFAGIRDLRLFGQQQHYEEKMSAMEQELNEDKIRLNGNAYLLRSAGESVTFLLAFILMLAGIALVTAGVLSGSTVFFAVVAFLASTAPVLALNQLGNGLIPAFAACRRVMELMDEQPAVRDAQHGLEPDAFTDLACDRVAFDYPQRPHTLQAIDLHIKRGDKIGISGPSGSGKSTLLKLMMRFWDPSQGTLLLNGQPVPLIRLHALRALEAVAFQEPFLFNQTIADNIRLGNPEATDDQIAAAAEQVNLRQMITALPDGFQTRVGELGNRLSTGERQRLALARLFVRDSDLILLDEPTGNVDRLNERIILHSLRESFHEKTMIMVSHRRSALNLAATVYKIENGSLQKEHEKQYDSDDEYKTYTE